MWALQALDKLEIYSVRYLLFRAREMIDNVMVNLRVNDLSEDFAIIAPGAFAVIHR